MIRIRHLIILLNALCLLSSCSDKDTTLIVTTNQMEFKYAGGQQTFTIESNDDWSIYGLPEWLSASQMSGVNTQEVTLTATENTTGLDREQVLSIRSNDGKNVLSLRVLQYANAAGKVFTVDDTSLKYFNGESSWNHMDSVVIHSSGKWRITGPQWLKMKFNNATSAMSGELREGSGTIYLYCHLPNTEDKARQGIVSVQTESGDGGVNIPVVQLGINDIKCVNMHIYSDGFWTDFKYGNETQYILFGIKEGIVPADLLESTEDCKACGLGGITWSDLKPDTDYTIYTRVMRTATTYNQKLNIEVIHTPTDIAQPRTIIEDVMQDAEGKWQFNTVMNEYAKGYYYIRFIGNNLGKYHYVQGFSNYIHIAPYYTEDLLFYDISDSDQTVLTWAVGMDEKLSDVIDMYKIYASGTASAPVWQRIPKIEHAAVMDAGDTNCELLVPLISTNIKTVKR